MENDQRAFVLHKLAQLELDLKKWSHTQHRSDQMVNRANYGLVDFAGPKGSKVESFVNCDSFLQPRFLF